MVKQFKHVTDLCIFDFNASFCLKKANNHSKMSLFISFEKKIAARHCRFVVGSICASDRGVLE